MTQDPLAALALLVQQGENTEAVACARRLMENSHSVEDIVGAVSKGLEALRNKCTVENFQLLDVLLASRAMVEVVDECLALRLQSRMDDIAGAFERLTSAPPRATLVIGTIQGDVHELGKHVVATLCRFSNIRVINLGRDVPPDRFVETAIAEEADFIGVSSLMTVCLPKIRLIKPALARRGADHIIVAAGGGSARQSSAETLDVDYVAYDAFDGLDFFMNHARVEGP